MSVPKKQTLTVLPTPHPALSNQPSYGLSEFLAEHGSPLTRLVERHHLAHRAKQALTVDMLEEQNRAIADISAKSHRAVRAWLTRWHQLFSEVGDETPAIIHETLQRAMEAELAGLMDAHRVSLDQLRHVFQAELMAMLARDEDEVIAESWRDRLEDLFSFGESRLKRKGLPPLTGWKAVFNPLTGGIIAGLDCRNAQQQTFEEEYIDVPASTVAAAE